MPTPEVNEFLLGHLCDPVDGSPIDPAASSPEEIRFGGGRGYPALDRRPILIDTQNSLFDVEEIRAGGSATMSPEFWDDQSWKTRIRRALPSPGDPHESIRRLDAVSALLPPSGSVLVLGCGNRSGWYSQRFGDQLVINSDVHLAFNADLAVDGHQIPFADGSFDAVVADQVLEHTAQPWIVAAEMERVTRVGGIIHASAPFAFPWHAEPYDYFRFTPSGLRSLFPRCSLGQLDSTDGAGSTVATYCSALAIEQSTNRRVRQLSLLVARLATAWIRVIDHRPLDAQRRCRAARGLAFTGQRDESTRALPQLLHEVTEHLRMTS